MDEVIGEHVCGFGGQMTKAARKLAHEISQRYGYAHDKLVPAIESALTSARNDALEQAARICELASYNGRTAPEHASAIRALANPTQRG